MWNPISWALKRPVTVITLAVGLLLMGAISARRMRVDIFPNLNLPVVYVCQPYGGMDPSQMEGLLTNYYEYHFLYINGIHHVESRNIQGLALMKLYFHPGTDMAQAMAETLGYVTRARAFMPPGTVSPFVTRFDAGSIPVGYLVLSSETRSISEIQDQALFKVRPMFSGLPGVSAPPPFGGSQRTIVLQLDPDRLKSYRMAPDEVIKALNTGNSISPSGTVRFGDTMPIVPVNSMAKSLDDFRQIPIRPGKLPTVHLGDVANVADAADVPVGSAIINGRKAVYLLVTKRADASTLEVIQNVRNALPDMQAVLPNDIKVALEFDQSPIVTNAINAVASEAILGAFLVGLMVLLFLRDWRSMVIVIINIPLAIAGAMILLWLSGQTLNLMTLGGLALAIGILVDESTVEIENIHSQLHKTENVCTAVRRGNRETAVPRLLALLCMLAVFAPSFLMTGAVRALFIPLSLSVGYAMISSYMLSSTLVPVLSAYLLKSTGNPLHGQLESGTTKSNSSGRELAKFALISGYLLVCCVSIWKLAPLAGFEIFPKVDAGRFQVRVKAPAGTRFEVTEKIVIDIVNSIREIVGEEGVEVSVGYVGNIGSSYPIQAIFQWTGGPEEAFLRVALNPEKARQNVDRTKELLREELAKRHPSVSFSLEPADIVSEVMSFGSPTPVDVVVSGSSLADVRTHAEKIRKELSGLDSIRDLRYGQTLDYPAIRVEIDRRRAGLSGLTAADISRSLVTATSSSRFIMPSYWPDPKSGIGYQVQIEIPFTSIESTEELENLPIHVGSDASPVVLRDVATVFNDQVPGEFDRYNMKRTISLTANVAIRNLAQVNQEVHQAVEAAGKPPAGVTTSIRGQLATLDEINQAGSVALLSTLIVIFLMLTAYFQSMGLALVSLSSVPAVGMGITIVLILTRTTWNLQSYMGSVMALGVSVANAILYVSFAESLRLGGLDSRLAAKQALKRRIRPVLMTALAMIAGMVPMALGLTEGGKQQAPLGRSVIGGLIGSLLAIVTIMPSFFEIIRKRSKRENHSLDPTDKESPMYDPLADGPLRTNVAAKTLVMGIHVLLLVLYPSVSKAQDSPIQRVPVVKAIPALIERKIEQPGQLEPIASAAIESRVRGWVKSVSVDIGDRVKKGQELLLIDVPELMARENVSKANVIKAESEVELAESLMAEAQEMLKSDQARLKALNEGIRGAESLVKQTEAELKRYRELVSAGAVTRTNLDEAEHGYQFASAKLNESRAMLASMEADVSTKNAQIQRRKSEIVVSKANLKLMNAMHEEALAQAGFAKITAPFDGVIVERNVEPGQLVSETHQSKPLLILQDIEKLTVTVGVPEIEAPIVNIGDEMQVFTSQDSANPAIVGRVERTSLAFNPITRTIRAEFDFSTQNDNLRSGQYVLVRIIGHKEQESVTVPNQAIIKIAGVPYCHVVENNRVRRVPVVLGVADTSRVAIKKGIKLEDLVAIGPVASTLSDGQNVSPAVQENQSLKP